MMTDGRKGATPIEGRKPKNQKDLRFPSPSQFHRIELRKGVTPEAAAAQMMEKLRAERSKRP